MAVSNPEKRGVYTVLQTWGQLETKATRGIIGPRNTMARWTKRRFLRDVSDGTLSLHIAAASASGQLLKSRLVRRWSQSSWRVRTAWPGMTIGQRPTPRLPKWEAVNVRCAARAFSTKADENRDHIRFFRDYYNLAVERRTRVLDHKPCRT